MLSSLPGAGIGVETKVSNQSFGHAHQNVGVIFVKTTTKPQHSYSFLREYKYDVSFSTKVTRYSS